MIKLIRIVQLVKVKIRECNYSRVKLCFSCLGFVDDRPIVRFRRRVRGKSDG